ncbi:cyclic di-GMP phosphodiesterase Gmr [Duganella sp. HH105]|nr:cyclic di-GMP phosphodiesterase Gmr [Duganella sp. HH105]
MSTIRESDIAARFGGDEFAVALLHSSIDNAKVFANKLIDAIAAPYQLGEIEARISVSVGVAGFPTTATDIDTLLKKADRAMYKAKEISKRQACGAIV